MTARFVLLWTDAVLWAGAFGLLAYGLHARRHAALRATWRRVWRDPAAMAASVVLAVFGLVTLVDSVHFRRALPAVAGASAEARTAYAAHTESLLDQLLAASVEGREATYSRPLAWQGFAKESVLREGQTVRSFPRLRFGGAHLAEPQHEWAADVARRAALGLLAGATLSMLSAGLLAAGLARSARRRGEALRWREALARLLRDDTALPWRTGLLAWGAVLLLAGLVAALAGHYHVLGTDRGGADVLHQALKSVRTAFVIGSIATLATLPLAIGLGLLAGYLGGWVDELIQYVYTVLSSVPNVLLIAACVLMVQVFLDEHPGLFETGLERADLKIVLLCLILGLTGWAGLCRLLRGETLKLRELDYVQAATAFGLGPVRILVRHILPNVMHLVLINTVLEFSGLILYEAVLSYVGVGVDPSMSSFGGMINGGREEMSRDPVVWWTFASAFGFMVTLVLAANFFADGVRDAFDPQARNLRARRQRARLADRERTT